MHTFAWDGVAGSLTPLGPALSTLVDDNDAGIPGTGTSELQLGPDGKCQMLSALYIHAGD